MQPSLSIIIVNWNSYEVTKNCLISLRDLSYPDFTVVLVDNGSADESGSQLKEQFPEIVLLRNEENLGFTGGNNTGIEYALNSDAELIMLLNNDTIVTPDFATALVKTLLTDDQIGAIQPKIMFNQERNVIWNAGSGFSRIWHETKTIGFGELDHGQFDLCKDIPWVTGCCFLTKSSIVREVGMLDDRFFIYYEDTDWSFRINGAGHRLVYEPMAKIYHEVGRSNDNREKFGEGDVSPFTHYVNVRNHIFIVRKYARGINLFTSVLYQFYKVMAYALYFLYKRRFKKLKASIRGFYHGFTFDI